LADEVGWERTPSDETGLMITSGTSGALLLVSMALLNPGDEAIIPDPYFVVYPALGPMTGGKDRALRYVPGLPHDRGAHRAAAYEEARSSC
jgi:aspartate/methionine/tyrosine aminotransferase